MYPGWRMRIYHNVTEDDHVFPLLCQLFCSHSHVDTCDTRQLPSEGDLNSKYPVGRMWRFQVTAIYFCNLMIIDDFIEAFRRSNSPEVSVSGHGQLDTAKRTVSGAGVGGRWKTPVPRDERSSQPQLSHHCWTLGSKQLSQFGESCDVER